MKKNGTNEIQIRIANPGDAEAIQKIYAPYVTDTAVTFEYTVPDIYELSARLLRTLRSFPYLVACDGDMVAGYAYAGSFRTREAYQHTAETSIYLDREWTGKGIGKALYLALEEYLKRQNVFTLYACITETERAEDPYLTDASILFHEHMGYKLAGQFYHCGYKFQQWYSMRWMEKEIVPCPEYPEAFIPFPDLLHCQGNR